MSKLLIANLKMNLEYDEILDYKEALENSNITDFIMCPSSIYLSTLKSDKYPLCAQNAYYLDEGAFTGEISFKQLNSMGVEYALIGHSERRYIFNETDDDIRRKLNSCIKNNIIPILCVGEHKKDRESEQENYVVSSQLKLAIDNLKIDNLIVAYEPVWAIGTGLTPTYEDIISMHNYIKYVLSENVDNVKVIYGGSVNESNIGDICSLEGVDGVLIGSASNDYNSLLRMHNIVK